MDQHQQLVLYNFSLERIEYYRHVRDCEPCFDYEDIRRKIAVLRVLAEDIDRQIDHFAELAHELYKMEVAHTPSGRIDYGFWKIDDPPEGWKNPRTVEIPKSSREEWTERPNTPPALDAWNRFLAALQQMPIRIYRISPKYVNEWEAEFRCRDGSSMFVSLGDLSGEPREPKTCGMRGADSLVTIVDQMSQWVERESTGATTKS